MKLLAFSDLHTDLDAATSLIERSTEADLVIGAGDFASVHERLEETIEALAAIVAPTILVPGNNETAEALGEAVSGSSWEARILHGSGTTIAGVDFYGLGAGVPTTPWDWSFDLSEAEAEAMLADYPGGGVLIVHSPPKGHCDLSSSNDHLGSTAILQAIKEKQPALAVCGHIHEAWGARSRVGETVVANLGPAGAEFEI